MGRSLFQIAFWTTSTLVGGYSVFLALLMVPSLQRFALYANVFHTAHWRDLEKPEFWGFAEKQVTSLSISTPDHASLYAWHILPLRLYYKHQDSLLGEIKAEHYPLTSSSVSMDLLRNSQSRVIIYFHGNAGCVADGWRPDAYRALAACDRVNTHIITFDYRGFGLSSSSPTEEGLIIDGIAVVDWVLKEARIPAERIVLLGHSLGTAVLTAVAEHYASSMPSSTFAGVVLVSGFSDLPTLMKTYMIGGLFPVLSPLTRLPRLQNFISANIIDTWETTARLTRLTAMSSKINIGILHARNDYDIGWKHSDMLFDAAARGMSGNDSKHGIEKYEEGSSYRTYEIRGKCVTRTLLEFGGHNQVLSHAPVALAIHAAFEKSVSHEN